MKGAVSTAPSIVRNGGMMDPLKLPIFRRIWLASMLSNLGLLIEAVGAAWAMTQLAGTADKVALVQTALMAPVMLFSIASGAIADMFDRRRVGIAALCITMSAATALSVVTSLGVLTPPLLLGFCFMIGTGSALFSPAWQSSVSEQVPAETLPQAIALNSISYNIARSFGPAIGGIIVAVAGAAAAFAVHVSLCIPLFVVLLLWRRQASPARLPPEGLMRAVSSGVRYVIHSPSIRTVLGRTLATGLAGASVSALMPIVARDLLGGGATVYGLILGAFGIGAVVGALAISRVRGTFDDERIVALCALILGGAVALVASSRITALTAVALFIAGAAWMVSVTVSNIVIQMSAPRWVAGRTLAAFQASIAGGVAIGSWIWGGVAETQGVSTALFISASVLAATALLGRWLPVPLVNREDAQSIDRDAPATVMALTGRSGPIIVEIDYRVAASNARPFYAAMQNVQLIRQRNGAYGWTIARSITDLEHWTERFSCPTWYDYLRHRNRLTTGEIALQREAHSFHYGAAPIHVRQMLERPFGSVRWTADALDPGTGDLLPAAGVIPAP